MVDGGVQTCIQTFLPVVVVCYMFKLLEFNKNSFFCSGILTIFLLISRVFFFSDAAVKLQFLLLFLIKAPITY